MSDEKKRTTTQNNLNFGKKGANDEQLLRVYLIDATHKTVYVNPDETTVEQLWIKVSEKLHLQGTSSECFMIWGVGDSMELLLYTDSYLSDVIEEWPELVQKYANPPQNKLLGNATLSRQKTQKNLPYKPKGTTPRAMQRRASFSIYSDESPLATTGESFKFVYRPTAIIPVFIERQIRDSESVHLFYIQAVHNVVNAYYPSSKKVAVALAAIQLQLDVGDHNPQVHKPGFLADSLYQYIPHHLYNTKKTEEWESILIEVHKKLSGENSLNLKKKYLKHCYKWPYYGSTFFNATYVPSNTSFFAQEFQGPVALGVNAVGVHLIDPKVMKILTYRFEDFVWWDSDGKKLGFGVALPMESAPRIYTFKTYQAALIHEVISDWHAQWNHERKVQKQKKKAEKQRKKKQLDEQSKKKFTLRKSRKIT